MSHVQPSFVIRRAESADILELARHRISMFRDMGTLASTDEAALAAATVEYLREAIPRGEYLAWVAQSARTTEVVGGAGVQLRPLLPRPRTDGIELGPEALILNVYVEAAWRRRGIAKALMHVVLDALSARGIHRIVLHASDDGRYLYESLGFASTNEMRLERQHQR